MTETMVASPDEPFDAAHWNRVDRESLMRHLRESLDVNTKKAWADYLGVELRAVAPSSALALHRQPAYDAVYQVIAALPCRSEGDYNQAAENGRIWRAVEAALDAMGVPK